MHSSARIPRWKRGYRGWRRWRTESKPHLLRSLSIEILQQVDKGRLLDETIDRLFSHRAVPESTRSLLYEITAGVLRRKSYLDWVLSHYVQRPVKKEVRYLLQAALYQSLFMKKGAYHVVNETVEWVKKEKGSAVANFVNAVLRKAAAEGPDLPLPSPPEKRLSVQYAFPEWLVQRWIARLGHSETEELLSMLDTAPEFTLRTTAARVSAESVIRQLHEQGIEARQGKFLESAVTVDKLWPVLTHDLFKKGAIHVQDEASQLAAHALTPAPGHLVLDACSGLGTKTEHLRELYPGIDLVAMDLHPVKAPQAGCLGVVRGDIVHLPFRPGVFDAILLDAPCSSLGIVRKHPEIKWRRQKKDIARFGGYQLSLLRAVWASLKRGGHCVYSVCSFEPEETLDVIAAFRKEQQFVLENPLPFLFNKEYFLSLPHKTGIDGFFIAKLRKA